MYLRTSAHPVRTDRIRHQRDHVRYIDRARMALDSDLQGGWDVRFQCYQAKVSIFQDLLLCTCLYCTSIMRLK